jgi:hypothetical protein
MLSGFSWHESAGGQYPLGLNGEREKQQIRDQELSMATLNDPKHPSGRLTTASIYADSGLCRPTAEDLR